MVSHTLPFGAVFGRELVAHIHRRYEASRELRPESVTSVMWGRVHPYSGPDYEAWFVGGFDQEYMNAENIFDVEGVPVHVSAADQQRMRGRTLDVIMGEGVVDVTPTI